MMHKLTLTLVLATVAMPAQAATTLDCKVAGCANVQEPDAWSAADAAVATVADVQRIDLPASPMLFGGVPAFAPPAPVFATVSPTVAPVAGDGVDWILPAAGLFGLGLVAVALSGDDGDWSPQVPQEMPLVPVIGNPISAVPDVSTWIQMLLGFASIAAMLRRRVRGRVVA